MSTTRKSPAMRIALSSKDRERFERLVDRSGGPNACHPWTGYCLPKGHGQFWVGDRTELAHRIAWVLAGNKITPEKPCILHDCPGGDLPACCNDRHLRDDTQAENNADIARKGRGTKSKRGLPFGVVERNGRFRSQIQINGKRFYLGTYDTARQASAVALAKKGGGR